MIYFYVLLFAADMEDMLLVHIELLPERHHIVSLDKSRYFSSSTNPLGYPRVWREYKKMTPNTFEWLYLTVTERHNMNRCVSRIWSWMKIFREEQPCEEDPGRSYDFMVCVKNSQAEWCLPSPHYDNNNIYYDNIILLQLLLLLIMMIIMMMMMIIITIIITGKRSWLSSWLGGFVWQVLAAVHSGFFIFSSSLSSP